MSILKEIIDDAIKAIDINTDLFYQNKIDEGYKQLDNTLIRISNAVEEIIRYQQESGHYVQGEKIVGILTEAMQALESKDALLLADILNYDLRKYLRI